MKISLKEKKRAVKLAHERRTQHRTEETELIRQILLLFYYLLISLPQTGHSQNLLKDTAETVLFRISSFFAFSRTGAVSGANSGGCRGLVCTFPR